MLIIIMNDFKVVGFPVATLIPASQPLLAYSTLEPGLKQQETLSITCDVPSIACMPQQCC